VRVAGHRELRLTDALAASEAAGVGSSFFLD
jgi:hypothetical protein